MSNLTSGLLCSPPKMFRFMELKLFPIVMRLWIIILIIGIAGTAYRPAGRYGEPVDQKVREAEFRFAPAVSLIRILKNGWILERKESLFPAAFTKANA